MPRLLELSKNDTSWAVLGRKVYRVTCCGRAMVQIDVRSLLPDEDFPFGRSAVLLGCGTCGRSVELQLLTDNKTSREQAWGSLEREFRRRKI